MFANGQCGRTLLRDAAEHLSLTSRSLDRVLKVARAIADLDASPEIAARHLGEALMYRGLDRTWRRPEE